MIKKCIGCGIKLQSEELLKPGYVKDMKMDYCMRCFKLKNYNEDSSLTPNYSNEEIISLINVTFEKCIFLVDILNLNSEVIDTFKKISIPKILVISKLDIIPRSIKLNNILKRIRMIYQIDEDIISVSSLKSININLIKAYLKDGKTCIAGYTNSGKSSLINAILEKDEVLTSNMINTTLDFIRIEKDNLLFYDSPGLNYLNVNNKKIRCAKNNVIKPLVYQLKPDSGLMVDDIVLYNTSNEVNNLTLYLTSDSHVKKIFKLVDADYLNMKLNNQDIVIKNVGFIAIRNAEDLKVTNDTNMIEVRDTIFKVI